MATRPAYILPVAFFSEVQRNQCGTVQRHNELLPSVQDTVGKLIHLLIY